MRTMHGLSGTKVHRTWKSMIRRCENPAHAAYKYYGARGIRVCPAWRESFVEFYRAVGNPPDARAELDRINNGLGYEPGNVRWITHRANCRNRRTTRLVAAFGETKTLKEWCDETGVDYHAAYCRLARGWDAHFALALR